VRRADMNSLLRECFCLKITGRLAGLKNHTRPPKPQPTPPPNRKTTTNQPPPPTGWVGLLVGGLLDNDSGLVLSKRRLLLKTGSIIERGMASKSKEAGRTNKD